MILSMSQPEGISGGSNVLPFKRGDRLSSSTGSESRRIETPALSFGDDALSDFERRRQLRPRSRKRLSGTAMGELIQLPVEHQPVDINEVWANHVAQVGMHDAILHLRPHRHRREIDHLEVRAELRAHLGDKSDAIQKQTRYYIRHLALEEQATRHSPDDVS